jgi:hypothetical protein
MSKQVDEIVDTLESQRERAIDAMAGANQGLDIDGRLSVYEAISPLDEERTYEIELEISDYELANLTQLISNQMTGASPAHEHIVWTSILMQLIQGAPEHVDRMSGFGADAGDIRGYQ